MRLTFSSTKREWGRGELNEKQNQMHSVSVFTYGDTSYGYWSIFYEHTHMEKTMRGHSERVASASQRAASEEINLMTL